MKDPAWYLGPRKGEQDSFASRRNSLGWRESDRTLREARLERRNEAGDIEFKRIARLDHAVRHKTP
jgi:hypothetical protein